MNTEQPLALKLADAIEAVARNAWDEGSSRYEELMIQATELRRLHDMLGKANALARIRGDRIAELEAEVEQLRQQLASTQHKPLFGDMIAAIPGLADELKAENEQLAGRGDPVAWRYQNANTEHVYLVWDKGTGGRNWTPLYAIPPNTDALLDQALEWIEAQPEPRMIGAAKLIAAIRKHQGMA